MIPYHVSRQYASQQKPKVLVCVCGGGGVGGGVLYTNTHMHKCQGCVQRAHKEEQRQWMNILGGRAEPGC